MCQEAPINCKSAVHASSIQLPARFLVSGQLRDGLKHRGGGGLRYPVLSIILRRWNFKSVPPAGSAQWRLFTGTATLFFGTRNCFIVTFAECVLLFLERLIDTLSHSQTEHCLERLTVVL